MTTEKVLALLLLHMLKRERKKNRKLRRVNKVRKIRERNKIIRILSSDVYRNRLKINFKCFSELLSLVRPHLDDESTGKPCVEDRLLGTLKYLATGCEYQDLGLACNMEEVKQILSKTLVAIWNALVKYIKLPKTEREWEDISSSFERKWHFPHCVGALGAKHIAIEEPAPGESPYDFKNHRDFHSIVLVAAVDADYQFKFLEVGTEGSKSDVPILRYTQHFLENLLEDTLNIPKPAPLKGWETPMPYVFVADNTMELFSEVMTPFKKDLSAEQRIYNYRLSRARRCFENAFGILYSRFGVFQKNISIGIREANKLVLACCALHNFLIKSNEDYIDDELLDRENVSKCTFRPAKWRLKRDGPWRDTHPIVSVCEVADGWGSDPEDSIAIRQNFCSYFNNEGKVSFQDAMSTVAPE